MNEYISLSKNDFYSIILIIPLFILYQLLGFITNYSSPVIIKNSADVYIKNFFSFFSSEYLNIIYMAFFIFMMLFIFIKNKDLFLSLEIKVSFLFGMVAESIIHSMCLLIVMSAFSTLLPLSLFFNNNIVENIYLSIGAGIWEELLFRYIMISSLFYLLNKVIFNFSIFSYLSIVILSSAIFSCYHFIGMSTDSITIPVFTYRFIAGILLSFIFIFRGLGIAVYTHAFYDLYLGFSGEY